MKRIIAVCMLVGCAAVSQAQQAAPEQATREDILRLFEAMQVRAQAEEMTRTMNEQMSAMMRAQMEKYAGDVSPELKTEIENMMKETMAAYPVDQVIEDMIPAYQKYLAKRYVNDIVAFYQSEAGKHILGQTPLIMREALPATMAHAQERMEPILERHQKRMIEIIEKHSREHSRQPGSTAAPPAAPAAKPAPKPAPKKPATKPQ